MSRATARTTSVLNRCWAKTSSARACEDRRGQSQPLDDVGQRFGLLADRFRERDFQVAAHDGQHHARHAPAGAHVEHFLVRLQKLGERQAIDQVAGNELLVIGVPREIDLRVPIPEQLAVPLEQRDLRLRQVDLMLGENGG